MEGCNKNENEGWRIVIASENENDNDEIGGNGHENSSEKYCDNINICYGHQSIHTHVCHIYTKCTHKYHVLTNSQTIHTNYTACIHTPWIHTYTMHGLKHGDTKTYKITSAPKSRACAYELVQV